MRTVPRGLTCDGRVVNGRAPAFFSGPANDTMKVATVSSGCECEARLFAELDERKVVLRGWAKDPRRGRELTAPANTVHARAGHFDVGWMCPWCTRNVLRSFDESSMVVRDIPAA